MRTDEKQRYAVTLGMGRDRGRVRVDRPNQDSVGTYRDYPRYSDRLETKGLLYVLADGMGGVAGGREASEMAVDVTIRAYYEDRDTDLVRSLTRAIRTANDRIYARSQESSDLRGMGTTIVVAVLYDDRLVVGNAGDSRAYLLHEDQLTQLSTDHSWVKMQEREGILSAEEAATHRGRNILTENLGSEPSTDPDFTETTIAADDTVLLCSDGVWNVISDEELADILIRNRGDEAAQTLIERANDRGGPDNISAIVLHVGRQSSSDSASRVIPPTGEEVSPEATTPTRRFAARVASDGRRRIFLAAAVGVALVVFIVIAVYIFTPL